MKKKTFLDHALELAALGFEIFPVKPYSKKPPMVKEFWSRATTRPNALRKLWKCDPISGVGAAYNPAISTTRFREYYLVVIDVDPKHGGLDTLEGLRVIMGYSFPDTYEQQSPSGGSHLVYASPVPCAGSAGQLGPGLDIRAHHGYIIGAGAKTGSGVYTNIVRPVVPAPGWLLKWADEHPPVARRLSSVGDGAYINRRLSLRKAHAWLDSQTPAPDGQRDAFAYKAACKLRGLGLSQADVAEQMILWFKYDEGQAPFTTDDIEHVTESAFKYAQGVPGEDAPESYFAPIEPEEAPESTSMEAETASEDTPESEFTRKNLLNRDHAAVMVGNKFRIMWEKKDHHGRYSREFLAPEDFRLRHASETIQSSDGKKVLSLTDQWLKWDGRRAYDGVVFAPGRELPSHFYNTWRGLAYEPLAKGEAPTAKMKEALDMFRTLVRENFCDGVEAHVKYLLSFLAHMIQKPQEKPRVAIVAKGGKGTGKSTLAQCVGALVEPHFFVAADQRSLLGNFNAHMGETTFFVLEEAVWGGNKVAESKLKDIVTRGHINVEQKFREVFRTDNYMRIMIIGNESWQVPASLKDERRWAVFNVEMRFLPFRTEAHKLKVVAWFDRLYTLMRQGGYRYLLTYLRGIDLEGVNVNVAPLTAGLIEQIEHTLSPLHEWWLECLRDGQIVDSDTPGWPRDIEKRGLREAFTRNCDGRRRKDWSLPSATAFGKELHHVCPSIVLDKKNAENQWIYRIPPLSVARREWAKVIGRTPVWPDDEEI